MEKLSVGDYVRTKDYEHIRSLIAKIIDIKGDYIYLDIDKNTNVVWTFDSITKHSKDIIELLKVGDIVTVFSDLHDNNGNQTFNINSENHLKYLKIGFDNGFFHLINVITKELFEANAYTIEKER